MEAIGNPGGRPADDSKTPMRSNPQSLDQREHAPSLYLLLLFLVLTAGIVATGFLFYSSYARNFRGEVERGLSSIAELKVGQLVQWRKERIGDASVFYKNKAFSGLVRRFLEKPADAEARGLILNWLGRVQGAYQCDRIFILDAQGIERLAVPEAPPAFVASYVLQQITEVLRSGKITFLDFHRDAPDRPIHLSLAIPVREESDGGQPLGFLVLRIDPATCLYPYISAWPIPSLTAETLLVRRDGNDALFLNELKFQKNTALKLRIPLTSTDVPAAKAALGQEGIVEGADYRGVPVVAAVRAVPDSPWFLVARMDTAEVYAPAREHLWVTAVLVGALLLAAGAGVGLVWRQQRVRFYRERYAAAEALKESKERLELAISAASMGTWRWNIKTDQDTRDANFNSMLGLKAAESTQSVKDFIQYVHPDDRAVVDEEIKRAIRERDIYRIEFRIVRPDGTIYWLSDRGKIYYDQKNEPAYMTGAVFNITERKKAEEALRASEERLRRAIEANKDGVWEWNILTNEEFFSPRWCEIIGYSFDDPELPHTYESWAKRIHPDDYERVQRALADHLEKGVTYDVDYRHRHKSGEYRWQNSSGKAVFDESGRPTKMVGCISDITERKLSQQRLEHERNLLRTLIEAIPDEIAVKDAERRFVLANPACVRALGKESAGEVLGKRDEDLIVIEFTEEDKLQEEQVLSSGKPFVNIEGKTRLDPVTGKIKRSILITKMPLRDKDGTITGLVVINRDITERKRAEVEIQRSRDWLNAILDASRDGIVAERNETIVYANAPYARIYGHDDPAALTGKHVSTVQFEPDNTRMLEYGRRRLEGESVPEVYEFKGRKKDGRFIDLEASVSTVSIAGEEHIVATIRDITERKSLQKQLIEAQKMESIATLAGGVAHDFNNILGIIMGHSSILEQTRENPDKFSQSVQAISKATFRGAGLVRQLLTFARKTDVTLQSVLINDTLNELAKLLEEILPKTIVMELNLEKKLPSILADPTQMHQVFLNLCVNARDAMMPKGGRLSLASRLVSGEAVVAKFHRAGAMEYIVVDVADSGAGMDNATRSRIFEPFFTTKEKGKGTGLGLATVYGIVESHRGFIDVESTVGVGSTFHVYLPVEPRQVKRDELEKVAEKEIPGGTETILVVEDEETLRDLVSFVLEGKGYRVLKASDGEEGLRLFTERMQDIALVLSDLGLPKISGEDLLKRVQQLKPGARVILASGYVEPETKSELLKAGAVEIVQKPYVPVEILKKIREALDSAV